MVEYENECDVVKSLSLSKFAEGEIVSCSSLWVVAAGVEADSDENENEYDSWSWSWSC